MSQNTQAARFQFKVDTASNWEKNKNSILLKNEIGFERNVNSNTGECKLKIGDGTSTWAQLPYITFEEAASSGGITEEEFKTLLAENLNINNTNENYGISQTLDSDMRFKATGCTEERLNFIKTLGYKEILNEGTDSEEVFFENGTEPLTSQSGTAKYAVSLNGKSRASGNRSLATGSNTLARGENSFTTGNFNIAYGESAVAEGTNTTALGNGSHAEGGYTVAGDFNNLNVMFSHAEGQSTQAKGNDSHAEGYCTEAIGKHAHAEGGRTIATGENSHAEGLDTQAISYTSHAEGGETKAEGLYSHAEGRYSETHNYGAHAEGHSFANGHYAHSEGYMSQANGSYSHAEGAHTKANLSFSHAEGRDSETVAKAYKVDRVEGNIVYIVTSYVDENGVSQHTNLINDGVQTGMYITTFDSYLERTVYKIINVSTFNITLETMPTGITRNSLVLVNNGAIGNIKYESIYDNNGEAIFTATTGASHAEGKNTRAAILGHAEGFNAKALGYVSHAEGMGTEALSDYQHVQGKYNVPDSENKYAHIVGNGTEENPSNAYTLDWYGNATFAGTIKSTTVASDEGTNSLRQGYENGKTSAPEISANSIAKEWAFSIPPKTNGEPDGVPIPLKNGKIVTGAFGANSVVLNGKSQAAGGKSFAAGSKSIALGNNAFATGNATFAAGHHSFTTGNETTASGNSAFAHGQRTQAVGTGTHAEGSETVAEGMFSHAEGVKSKTTASTQGAHVSGGHTVANGSYSFVGGVWNAIDNENFPGTNGPTEDGKRKYAVIVGNGLSETARSNAMTLDWNGNAWFAGGIILTSPNGTKYKLTVSNDGQPVFNQFTE